MTATVVSNLLGLLIMGIGSLFAVLSDERQHVQAEIRREEQLSRQDAEAARLESLGRMASGIAHDFNRVLAVVAGGLDLVRQEWQDQTDAAMEDLQSIRHAAERGGRLTRRLMILARQQGSDQQTFRPVDLVLDLVPLLTRTVDNGQELATSTQSVGYVHMSPTQFEQLLLNLVLNAHEASPAGGSIMVEVEDVQLATPRDLSHGTCDTGQWVRVSVRDDGSGIAPDMLPRLFAPFATTKGEVARGIGMMTVQQASDAAEGRIHVESSRESGTRIEIWLPAVAAPSPVLVSAGVA
jgi:signal transduction histidine kinase